MITSFKIKTIIAFGRIVLKIAFEETCRPRGVVASMQRCEEKRAMSKVILVPLDGSEVATSILQQVVALARRSEARLLLLTVGLPMPVLPSQASEMPPSRTFQAEAYLDHIRAYLANEGLEACTMICLGDPATEILHCAARQQVDFIVINSRGGGGSPLPFLGSVAEKVARATTVPVIVFYD